MTELEFLRERKRELNWSMLLRTPMSFDTPGARRERQELGQVTSRIRTLIGEA